MNETANIYGAQLSQTNDGPRAAYNSEPGIIGGDCELRAATPRNEQVAPFPPHGKARSINIDPLNHGYVVRVGCQSFAIESAEKLTVFLLKYLNNPEQTENQWFNGELGLNK